MKTELKNIYWIDINWINKEIEEVKYLISIRESEFPQTSEDFSNLHKEILLETIKNQLKPITRLIEDTFDNGYNRGFDSASGEYDIISLSKQDYINTKQF